MFLATEMSTKTGFTFQMRSTIFIRLLDRVFYLSRLTTSNYISLMRFCYILQVFPFLNNPKDLVPSYKMDLDFWDCCGRKKLCLIINEIWYSERKEFCS